MNNSAFFTYPEETVQPPDTFLAGLPDDDVVAILSYMQARRYVHEEVAIQQGDAERSLFVVTTGRFEVLVPTLQGPRRMRLAQAGDIFGELAFFDGQARSAEVRAFGAAEALMLTLADFERLRVARPDLALLFVMELGRVISQRYRAYSARLAALGEG